MTQYMGIDWLAVCITFPAIYLLSRKSRKGFLLMVAGNLCWALIGYLAESYAMTAANLCFLIMNLHAYASWAHGDPRPLRTAPANRPSLHDNRQSPV
ncbi:MAG: nicotinamide mononucleotide transporter [Burkholderiales bacterium]|nr:nicotinamide mononucleotide transporter [Burkholderiales bacterium]